jgi:hypothetical protein
LDALTELTDEEKEMVMRTNLIMIRQCIQQLGSPRKKDRCKHDIHGTDCFECYPEEPSPLERNLKAQAKLLSQAEEALFESKRELGFMLSVNPARQGGLYTQAWEKSKAAHQALLLHRLENP